ncbi:hypothetical protein LR48_Vigan10g137200, partial [Vigna angularis]
RGWENLASYPILANVAVVREFYTNARAFGIETQQYSSYVRGKRIPYDADTINRFLGIEWTGEQCQFDLTVEEGPDFADLEREEFLARSGWPADPSHTGSGVGAAEASTVEEEEEEEEE